MTRIRVKFACIAPRGDALAGVNFVDLDATTATGGARLLTGQGDGAFGLFFQLVTYDNDATAVIDDRARVAGRDLIVRASTDNDILALAQAGQEVEQVAFTSGRVFVASPEGRGIGVCGRSHRGGRRSGCDH